jgi:hypothetical protein
MSNKFEIRGMLAKCLAMEDIIVEHKKVETACFNVHTRCLTLPLWERASNDVYTMLVLHEISHSLFSPDIDWTEDYKIPQQFVNVCEDARVEKLCKRKYPGSPKSFYAGYKELNDQDFFSIADEDLDTFNLADKVNLYFKVGNFLKLDFSSKEKEIVDLVGAAETFPEVLNAAEVLYKYCKEKQNEETKVNLDSHENPTSGSGGDFGPDDFENQEEGDNDQPESSGDNGSGSDQGSQEEGNQPQNQNGPQGGEHNEEPEVKTMDSLEEALKELVNKNGYENVYLEIPKLELDKVIVPNAEIHDKCKQTWENFLQRTEYTYDHVFGEVDKKYNEFRRSAQKEVGYLVKEFECRKAADSYARASTSRTGVLDCARLHNYKFSEDLFKKVTTLADGKNHGLVFVLDWSGSMGDVMLDTVKQLFNLIWFCKKVAIPFEVYAFTNEYPILKYDENGKSDLRLSSYKKKDGLIHIGEWFSMMNVLTSKVNNKTLETQMKNIFRLAYAFGRHSYTSYDVPMGMGLSGTPLNESLIALHQILPKFQRENKLQKVQCVILTDGEGCGLKYHKEFQRKWETEPYLGTNHISNDCFLRDRKTGNTYSLDCDYYQMTDILLKNLRDNFTNTNFIGIRVMESRDSGHFIRRYCGHYGSDYEKVMNSWKKEKAFSIKNSGYNVYFGLSASALSQETEFAVAEDATKSQIKNAFMKSLKSKKMNKKILGEFIELVA